MIKEYLTTQKRGNVAGMAVVACFVAACIFHYEAQAVIEHATGWAYGGGYCRVRNVKAIRGNGELRGGTYASSREISGHVRGYKDGKVVELTWLESEPVIVDAVITVKDYRIVSAKVTGDEAGNLRYVRAALLTDWVVNKFI